MSIIKHVTLQKIVAHDFQYDPRRNKLQATHQLLLPATEELLEYVYPNRKGLPHTGMAWRRG